MCSHKVCVRGGAHGGHCTERCNGWKDQVVVSSERRVMAVVWWEARGPWTPDARAVGL